MELTLDNLKTEVMRLSAANRSRLLDALLDSIDQDDAIEREWETLADRRDAELDSGMVEAVDGAVALACLQSKNPG